MLTIKEYAYSYNKEEVKKIYESSFPKCERFPFWILKNCSKNSNVQLNCIMSDNIPIGMQFIVKYDDISYLMYFAIDEKYRNAGYGSDALKNIIIRNDNILLCIERPDEKDTLKSRRKDFYLRNGFYETGCCIEDTGVTYEFLSSVKGYKPTVKELKARYTFMSENPIIQYAIKHTFDTDCIKLVD